MDESAIKGLKLLELNDASRKTRITTTTTTISVEGYDTWLQEYSLKLALTKHFSSSCGRIGHIYVPRDFKRGILKSVSFMWMEGEDVEDKALKLTGTDVGGWTAIVKAAYSQQEYMDPHPARTKEHMVCVSGYHTALPKIDTQIALCKHFSSCGEVTKVHVFDSGSALIYLKGDRCLDKALKLCGCNMGGMNLVVKPNLLTPEEVKNTKGRPLRRTCSNYGYTPPSVLLLGAEQKKKKIEMELDKEMDAKKKKKMKMELMKTENEIKKHTEKIMKIDRDRKTRMERENLEMALV